MNIPVKGEYALHALLDIALQRPGTPVKIGDIAKRQRIPQKFLESILAGLRQSGFVESRRGAEGGYLLARNADALTVGEVLRYLDGDVRGNKRRRRGASPFDDLWNRVEQAVSHELDRTTIGEIARAWREKQSTYVPNWDI